MDKNILLRIVCFTALSSSLFAQERNGLLNRRVPGRPIEVQSKSLPKAARTGNGPTNSPTPAKVEPAIVVPPASNSALEVAKEDSSNPKLASNPLAESARGPRSLLATDPTPEVAKPITVATEAEKNQTVAEGWTKPWACLVLTGRQHGYIEPCGCTGLENQKGGLNRRDTLLRSLVDRGWDVIPIDAGDQVRGVVRQDEIKFAKTAEAFKLMGYAAVMYGKEELKLSSTELYLKLTDNTGKFNSPFVAANIGILEQDKPDRYKVIQVGKRRIAVTGVLGNELAKDINNNDITISSAVQALKKIAPSIQSERCDFKVLIAHTSIEDSVLLAQQVPIFDLVITAGGFGEPFYKPEPIPGTKSVMLQVGVKGMYAGVVGLYDDTLEPLKYQRLALSSQFEDSPRIMQLFAQYQKELKEGGLEGLGLRPLSHPSTREFIGTEKCGECHTTALEKWEASPHAHATDSIINPPKRGEVARHFDPECIACHVTGWNPEFVYPYLSGYVSLEKSKHLLGSGCENCHGPGSQHVAAESGDFEASKEMLTKLREEMRLPLASAQDKCIKCHDADNSPNFDFQKYWEQIEHIGKD